MERLLAWYRVSSSVGAVVALVAANLVPLAGVLFLGWSVWTILTVYWLENGIVGFYNVLKMATVSGIGKLGVIPFFVIHYGIFWLVHGVFVMTLPEMTGFVSGPIGQPFVCDPLMPEGVGCVPIDVAPRTGMDQSAVVIAAIGLFISHGVSFVFNFILRGEHRKTNATLLMFAPYRRVVILHLTILFGAFAVAAFGAQLIPLVILVTLKTVVDLGFHLGEHRAAAASSAPTPN